MQPHLIKNRAVNNAASKAVPSAVARAVTGDGAIGYTQGAATVGNAASNVGVAAAVRADCRVAGNCAARNGQGASIIEYGAALVIGGWGVSIRDPQPGDRDVETLGDMEDAKLRYATGRASFHGQNRRAGATNRQILVKQQFGGRQRDRAGDGEINRVVSDGFNYALPQRSGASIV